jgi:biotin carboxyl carrier protein
MTFLVETPGGAVSIELAKSGETWRYRFGSEEEGTASVEEVEPGVYSVIAGGRSYEVRVSPGEVRVGGRLAGIELRDPRRQSKRTGRGAHEGRYAVVSPMPGKVVRVLVKEGQEVGPGQGIAVVEAMKMQNEMKTRRAGRVISLAAREGATVAAGEVLAVVE